MKSGRLPGCEFVAPLVATQGCAGSKYKENTKWNKLPCRSDSKNRLVLALGQGERREQEKMNVKVGAASKTFLL
jgi:hypothetical protein